MNRISIAIFVASFIFLGTIALYAERKSLPRPTLKRIDHAPTGSRLRFDPKTGQHLEYELEGKITYDGGSGNFLLSGEGIEGERKTIIYEPATKLDAMVEARVDYDPREGAYLYSYVLWNLPTSRQKLQSFYLEAKAPIREVKAPEVWTPERPSWYSRPLTKYLQEQFEVEAGWVWSDVLRPRLGLLPAQKTGGFSFLSPGLPGVVKCYVRPYGKLKGVGEELPEELHAAIDRVAWKIPQGLTVGPAAPPDPFHPVRFVGKIRQMLDVSVQQGWVESPQVAREFTAMLTTAENALAQRETRSASDILHKLLERVEQENQRTLLSEAYALLKFNLEYLQRHLVNAEQSDLRLSQPAPQRKP